MEHPWLLVVSVLACGPLLWITYALLFPNLRGDLSEDGVPLLVGVVSGWWPATWTLLKVILLVVFSALYVTAGYKLAVWLFA